MSDEFLTARDEARLVEVARTAVHAAARELDMPVVDRAAFDDGASFVTLMVGDALRGCLGSLVPTMPLDEDVSHNAYKAATADPRFPKLEEHELDLLEVKVSVLTPLEPFDVESMDELLAELGRGQGLLVRSRFGRATFLPAVWDKLDSTEQFVEHLWHKAGFIPRLWPRDLEIFVYGTREFSSRDYD